MIEPIEIDKHAHAVGLVGFHPPRVKCAIAFLFSGLGIHPETQPIPHLIAATLMARLFGQA